MEILIWLGSGFAFSVGFVAGFTAAMFVPNRAATKRLEAALRAEHFLEERNEIGHTHARLLLRIAEAMEAKR